MITAQRSSVFLQSLAATAKAENINTTIAPLALQQKAVNYKLMGSYYILKIIVCYLQLWEEEHPLLVCFWIIQSTNNKKEVILIHLHVTSLVTILVTTEFSSELIAHSSEVIL